MSSDQMTGTTGSSATTDTAAEGAPGACGCVSRRQSFVVAGAAVAGTAGLDRVRCGGGRGQRSGLVGRLGGVVGGGRRHRGRGDPGGRRQGVRELKVVVTQPTAGDFKAFSATCPHQGCSVGSVKDNVITCPCHGSQFDAATGEVKKGPATKGLEAKSVTVGADGIKIT